MEIPTDLLSLKRVEIQSLCKSHGIKANGKTADMVKTLEQVREEQQRIKDCEHVSVPPCENDSTQKCISPTKETLPPVTALDQPMAIDKKTNKRGERKGGRKMRKGSNQRKIDNETTCGTSDSGMEELHFSLGSQAKMPAPDSSQTISPTVTREPLLHKRKRRDTYSVSPDPSLSSLAKMPHLDLPSIESTPLPGSPPPILADNNNTSVTGSVTNYISSSDETTTTGSRKRKCYSTYTVSSPELNTSEPLGSPAIKAESEGTSEKQERRLTFEVLPASPSEAVVSGSSGSTVTDLTGTPDLKHQDNIMAELQNLLDKKVSERKADPSYKPVHSAMATLASRIPVQTKTQKKFDRAHTNQFKRMKSIVGNQEERKRKSRISQHVPSCAKRPRLSEGRSSVKKQQEVSKSVKKNVSSKTPRTGTSHKYSLTAKTPSTALSHAARKVNEFTPTITNTKDANFHFSEKIKQTAKTPESQFKTLRTSLAFTDSKTAQTKKPVSNLQKSTKTKPSYKPHKGPLPKFKF